MITDPPLLVVVAGPTAVGKTSLSIELAQRHKTAVISADSRQFYREMRIGTAVPAEWQLKQVPHHFIHHLSVCDTYNVSRFEADCLRLLPELFGHNRVVVMTGGSGLYINAVCNGIDQLPDPDPGIRERLKETLRTGGTEALYEELIRLDPVYSLQVDPKNPARLVRALEVCITTGLPYSQFRTNIPAARSFRILKIGLTLPRPQLNARIDQRTDAMIAQGLVDEARALYPLREMNALNTVGYRELFDYFEGQCSLPEAIEKIKVNTRRYVKRQMTWFGKDKEYRWFSPDESDRIDEEVRKTLADHG